MLIDLLSNERVLIRGGVIEGSLRHTSLMAASTSFLSRSSPSLPKSSHATFTTMEDFTPFHSSNALVLEDLIGGAGELVIDVDAIALAEGETTSPPWEGRDCPSLFCVFRW